MARTLNQQIYWCGWKHLFSGKRQTQCINDWIEDQLDRTATGGGNHLQQNGSLRSSIVPAQGAGVATTTTYVFTWHHIVAMVAVIAVAVYLIKQ